VGDIQVVGGFEVGRHCREPDVAACCDNCQHGASWLTLVFFRVIAIADRKAKEIALVTPAKSKLLELHLLFQ